MSQGQQVGQIFEREEIRGTFIEKERSLSEILNLIKQDTKKDSTNNKDFGINQQQSVKQTKERKKSEKVMHQQSKRSYKKKDNCCGQLNVEQNEKKGKEQQKSKKRIYTKRTDQKVCRWTSDESALYVKFIEMYLDIMRDTGSKRNKKIFLLMSKFIGTKTACQCRSHHQKFFKKVINMLTADPNEAANYTKEDKRKLKKKIKKKEKEREQAALLSKMKFDENNPLGIGNKMYQGFLTIFKFISDDHNNQANLNFKVPTNQQQFLQSDFSPLFGPHLTPSPLVKPSPQIQHQNPPQLLIGENVKIANSNSIVSISQFYQLFQKLEEPLEGKNLQNDQQFKEFPMPSPLIAFQQGVQRDMLRKLSLDNFGYTVKQDDHDDLFSQNYINQ